MSYFHKVEIEPSGLSQTYLYISKKICMIIEKKTLKANT